MKDILEKWFKRPINISEDKEVGRKLPLVYTSNYNFYRVSWDDVEWLLLVPLSQVRINRLQKQYQLIEQNTGMNCAFYFDTIQYYSKEAMIEKGIPFIFSNKQMYLPFLGISLQNKRERIVQPIERISFLTQKLILSAIYEKWHGINATQIAEFLNVSKMSISRCLDEIEAMNIPIIDITSKTRRVSVGSNRNELWESIKTQLRSPVIARFVLEDDIALNKKAGISALSELSMISDNKYITYGVIKKNIKESGIRNKKIASLEHDIGCEVLELGYFIDFQGKGVQDPLSIILSLKDDEIEDERIQMCIDEMLEEYVW